MSSGGGSGSLSSSGGQKSRTSRTATSRSANTPTVEAPVYVRCSSCGGDFELSARNHREHVKKGTQPRCAECRHGRAPRAKPSEADRRWWLERFSIEEIVQLAGAIWPDELAGSYHGKVDRLHLHDRGNGVGLVELDDVDYA